MTNTALQTTSEASTLDAPDTTTARREVINKIAKMDEKITRVALFSRMILFPTNAEDNDSTHRDTTLKALKSQVRDMQHVRELLTGTYDADDVAPEIAEWVFEMAKSIPDHTDRVLGIIMMAKNLEEACLESAEALATAAKAFTEKCNEWNGTITYELCSALWGALTSQREQKANEAMQTAKAVSAILSRLEYIGKHVRLVSLNASVEAARAGEAGRGLAVIATEFKGLAEEIQSLATTARAEIDPK